MRSVTLFGTSIEASALGFGCSALLGEKTDASALALLKVAFDSGIRYFDVAPMYGQGRAEAVLGMFAEHKRNDIAIATKFGIEPSLPAVARSSFVRNIARAAMRSSPYLRRWIGRASKSTLATGRFHPDSARRSIERSLLLLRTAYLDVLLLHDCRLEDLVNSDDLVRLLQQLVQEGKVRTFGIGTSPQATAAILKEHPAFAGVAQFASGVLQPNLERIRPPGAVVTHGSLGGSLTALVRYLRERPGIARDWSASLDADCSSGTVLAALMLSSALRANTRGPVLFSSRDPERIRLNSELANSCAFSVSQLDLFEKHTGEAGINPD